MPRLARQKSYTDVYHIILRGINKQDIFFDEIDRWKFLKELKRCKEKYKFEVLAYCLMDNHVHIMIKDNEKHINKIMQSMNVSYAIYFNKRHERVGHLFSNRYNSRVVENQNYLLNLQKYIHQNPEKAGIEKTNKYKWSSYHEYIGESKFADTEFILDLLSDNRNNAIEEFKRINLKHMILDNVEDILEYEMLTGISDEEARKLIELKIGQENLQNIHKYNSKLRNEILKQILEIKGISNRQISRVIGIHRKILDRLK